MYVISSFALSAVCTSLSCHSSCGVWATRNTDVHLCRCPGRTAGLHHTGARHSVSETVGSVNAEPESVTEVSSRATLGIARCLPSPGSLSPILTPCPEPALLGF